MVTIETKDLSMVQVSVSFSFSFIIEIYIKLTYFTVRIMEHSSEDFCNFP